MHSQPRWPIWFAFFQLHYGLPLLIVGVLAALGDERLPRPLVEAGFPFFTLAAIHLSLAWNWYKRNALLWLSMLASLVAWPAMPIWLRYVYHDYHDPSLAFHGGSSGMAGGPSAGILLIVIAIFMAILCLYFLSCGMAIYIFIYRKSWFGQGSPLTRFSLGSVLVISAVLPAAIGLDWSIPANRAARHKKEMYEAPLRAVNEYIEAVLAEDEQEIAIKLTACRRSEAFLETLRHRDGRVRAASVHALADPNRRLDYKEMVKLLGVVEDRNEANDLRREALKAIAKGEFSVRIAADNPFVVEELIAVISRLSRDSPARPGQEPQTTAINMLKIIGPDASEAVPALIVALDHEKEGWFAVAAASALGSIGPAAESAIPVLERKASQHRNLDLQAASQLAIKKIQASRPVSPP